MQDLHGYLTVSERIRTDQRRVGQSTWHATLDAAVADADARWRQGGRDTRLIRVQVIALEACRVLWKSIDLHDDAMIPYEREEPPLWQAAQDAWDHAITTDTWVAFTYQGTRYRSTRSHAYVYITEDDGTPVATYTRVR